LEMCFRDVSSSPVAVAVERNVTPDIILPYDETFQLQLSYMSEPGKSECTASTPLPERQEEFDGNSSLLSTRSPFQVDVKSPNTSPSVRIDVSDSSMCLSMSFDESSFEDADYSQVSFIIILSF
jgi:hypothetical protein